MKRVPLEILDELDLPTAVENEASAWRNQLPQEPWVEAIADKKDDVAAWVHDRLSAGLPAVPNTMVNVRKASLGTRPVPIMGVAERVTYRALASYILKDAAPTDRSPDAYKQFLYGPIAHAFRDTKEWWPQNASLKYVVEADIAAFYQYVDHDSLRQELELQTGKIDVVDLLMELLAETEQRSFGLPQLIDASDWLSEVYIRIVERDLVRSGWPTWRYNDDFRIGCRDYTEALDAVEQLEVAARAVGLTVSDYKTYTPSFLTYFIRNTGLDVSDTTLTIDPSDVEVIVVEYATLDDDEQMESAMATLNRTRVNKRDDSAIDLKRATRDDVRALRRAISALTRHEEQAGLEFVMDLLVYIPSLTPRICDYLIAVGPADTRARVTAIVDDVLAEVSLGEWQAHWFTHVCRRLDLLPPASPRLEWVRTQRERGRGRLLGAEAALALAEVGEADFDDLDRALRAEPEALAPWFLLAMKSMATLEPRNYGNRARAVRDSAPLNRFLLDI